MITFNSFSKWRASGSIFTLHTRKKQKKSGGGAAKIIKDFFLGRFLKGTSQCLKHYQKDLILFYKVNEIIFGDFWTLSNVMIFSIEFVLLKDEIFLDNFQPLWNKDLY